MCTIQKCGNAEEIIVAANLEGMEETDTVSKSTEDGEESCQDQHSCLALELGQWLEQVKDKKFQPECKVGTTTNEDPKATAQPLYKIVDCKEKGSVWQFKYAGGKGKKRIFHGKGKLSFSKLSSPPHGYDYGMKSGVCVAFEDPDTVQSIEGQFEQGIPNGDMVIGYFDGRAVRARFESGVITGLARTYVTDINPETNSPRPDKKISSVAYFEAGTAVGPRWNFLDEGILTFTTSGTSEALAVVPIGNETRYLTGILEEEDMMMSDVHDVKLIALSDENCMKTVKFQPTGDKFDFDLQIKASVKKTVAKLIRFFEVVTESDWDPSLTFSPLEEPVNKRTANMIISELRKDENNNFLFKTVDGQSRGKFEGNLDVEGLPNGPGNMIILSDYRRRDILSKEALKNATDGKAAESFLQEFIPLEQAFGLRSNKTIKNIQGEFESGKPTGLVKVSFMGGVVHEGLAVGGAFHGLVRHLAAPFSKGRRKRYVSRNSDNAPIGMSSAVGSDQIITEVTFIGIYRNGFMDGPAWNFLVGGTYLFGLLKKTLAFTTDHGAFVNQDLESGYFGAFEDGKMLAGRIGKIIGQTIQDGIRMPEFSDLEDKVYKHLLAEPGKIVEPLVTDVSEDIWVTVKQSTVPDAGEGLFTKRTIPTATVFAYFGGLRYSTKDWAAQKPLLPSYWIKVDGEDEIIHLSDELGKDTGKYRATLGHKINHSFQKQNCKFHSLDHPRFGLIPAARSISTIPEGEEIFCSYELKYDEGDPWYQELWRVEKDEDTIWGPFGHRGHKHNLSEPIMPMLANDSLYKEFYAHAVEVLKLEPTT